MSAYNEILSFTATEFNWFFILILNYSIININILEIKLKLFSCNSYQLVLMLSSWNMSISIRKEALAK